MIQLHNPPHMQTLVVIVNYRTARLTVDCLASLATEGSAPAALRAVVVDNASGDGSVEAIREAVASRGWSAWAEVVDAGRNGGFSFGNNEAIRAALESSDAPQYVLLLNSDTVVRPGAVQTLVRFLETHPEAAMVGSRLEDPDGTPQASTFRFPSIRSELAEAAKLGPLDRLLSKHVVFAGVPSEVCQVDWVAGASLLVRREVFEKVGLLDENYFLYYEEVDFCLRAARGGFSCWYEPASRVVHFVGASTGVTSRSQPRRRPKYWFDSRRRYFVKNHGRLYAAAVDMVWSMAFGLRRLREILQRRPNVESPRLLGDYLRNCVFVRGFSV
ncbi:MAG: glycosyltransferase family 2 protein [Planctomycetales bacterium]|nr:glycosyltransferase family 2 protein [Planctomycetales bacterium]